MSSKIDLSYPAVLKLFEPFAAGQTTETRQFLAWFLSNYYRLEQTEVDDAIIDESYDKGLDAIYVNEQLAQIDVFQSRIVKSKKTLGDSSLHEFYGVLAQFKSGATVKVMETSTQNKDLARLLRESQIGKKVDEGYEVRGVFLTNAPKDQNAIDYLKTTPNLILYDQIELERDFVPIDKTEPIAKSISFDVSGVPSMHYPIDATLSMAVAPISASELVQMQGISSGELFAWNVRQWLRKTKVNKDIELSIRTPAEHKFFPAFHNGLTVLCKTLDVSAQKITISGYAVVNGCQSLTGLNENRKFLSSDLRIMTKFIQISPETPLALKITDHTNNQNGTTSRDLQSNNPIQARLQSEFNMHFGGSFHYRIKRGEHPEWNQDQVIENDLAARVLLAFDLKRPWECHQTYKLFDESHAAIFGRPEVDAGRIVLVYKSYQIILGKLPLIENESFGWYGLTRFLFLYLLRECLDSDGEGKQFCLNPAAFFAQKDGEVRALRCVDSVSQVVARLLSSEVKRRDADKSGPFDYKSALKSPNVVRELGSTIDGHYRIAVDAVGAPTFSSEWQKVN